MQNWVYTIKISYFCLQFCPQFGLITDILAIWIMNCNTLGAYIWINMVKYMTEKSWHTLTFKWDIMGSNPKADIPWLSSGISWIRILKLTYLDFQAGYHGFESQSWHTLTFKRDIMGSNPAWVKIILRPLVCLSYTPHALRQVLNGQGGAWWQTAAPSVHG